MIKTNQKIVKNNTVEDRTWIPSVSTSVSYSLLADKFIS